MSIQTFFNVITFPEGDDKAAFEAWQAVGKFMTQQSGFLGSTLYKNIRNPKMFINKGRYDSPEAFMKCVQNTEFQQLSQVLTDLGVERTAGLYEEVEQFGAGGN